MFGSKKPHLVGAKEKRLQAAMLKGGQNFDDIKAKREGQTPSAAAPIVLIYIMSCTLAWLMSHDSDGKSFKTGIDSIDNLAFSTTPAFMTGNSDIDDVLNIALRGLVFFAMAGFFPLAAWVWQKLLDKANMNPFRLFWGVMVGVPMVYYFLIALGPVFNDLMGLLT